MSGVVISHGSPSAIKLLRWLKSFVDAEVTGLEGFVH